MLQLLVPKMLRIENLSVKYTATSQKVLDSINFDVAKGEVIAIIGPSGCGKTTLLNAIAGLEIAGETLQEGRVVLETKKIATVFQEPRLLPWRNVLRNVSFGLEASGESPLDADKRALQALKIVGLENFGHYYPSQLSLGMKQRVNFARAIVCDPDLLLMDEPFSALDSETKQTIIIEFKKIIKKQGLTTVFVTHSKDEASILADRIVSLNSSFVGISNNRGLEDIQQDIFSQNSEAED